MSSTGSNIKKNLEKYCAGHRIIVHFIRKSNPTPEKLTTQIRPKSRMEEIQTNGKNPMALVKAKSRLEHHVNLY